ncbi:signal peptidase I [Candidatus Peregrinibacteria bacterium]|jgi:signal peptidase I|nr:signal peptidase I [Candidatus Peregrinibacteria bacterium]MBT7484157.1 signal peptidase I [Candidatus Peregrinibacteria bacterium]MBT7703523.1 signal peptidase I [Candidatus Peregrinibacteria bacterium]
MKPRLRSFLLFVLDVVVNSLVIIILVVLIRTFIFSPFQIHGPSMCDTFNNFDGSCLRGNGEYIMIYKFGYLNILGWEIGAPERGDVVVFQEPEGNDYYIKRIIGIPGDTVEIIDGYVYLNDEKLDESEYLNEVNWGYTDPSSPENSFFEVPEGGYFVLGDNRKASSDSRRCFSATGCIGAGSTAYVTLDEIAGRAWFVMWPLDRIRVVERAEIITTDL